MKALQDIKAEKRTAFVVTHRSNLLSAADMIMVLADGVIQTFGPRDAVVKSLMARAAPVSVAPARSGNAP
jgi:ABC-type protease/lipase transport system fused ATPase/permease subunit